MNTKLTLQEKLRDLRDERNLTLTELEKATGIPTTNLHRLEDNGELRVGYQDVYILARFYDVSADYLFGLTDNRQYRGAGFDALHLSDEAVAELQSGHLNNRALSELITHPDFADMLVMLEVYVDRTISDWLSLIHKAYNFAVNENKEAFTAEGRDIELAALDQLSEDPSDYLRFRLMQHFDHIAQSIYEEHKKDAPPDSESDIIKPIGEQLRVFQQTTNRSGDAIRGVAAMFANQLGFAFDKIPENEKKAITRFLGRANFIKAAKKRGKRHGF
jgi:transcriptional regulator with XRE-family HTH domain